MKVTWDQALSLQCFEILLVIFSAWWWIWEWGVFSQGGLCSLWFNSKACLLCYKDGITQTGMYPLQYVCIYIYIYIYKHWLDQLVIEGPCACSDCVMCIPVMLSGSSNECWLRTCDACITKTWRLQTLQGACHNLFNFYSTVKYCRVRITNCSNIFRAACYMYVTVLLSIN